MLQDPKSNNDNKDVSEKGFYISFDDDQPKRPKPPLRAKRSPRKNKRSSHEQLPIESSGGGVGGGSHQMTNKSESDSLSGEGSCSNDILTPNNNPNGKQKRLYSENSRSRKNNADADADDDDGGGGGVGGGIAATYSHPQMMTNDSSNMEINRATYNKYTDSPIHLRQVMALGGNQGATLNCPNADDDVVDNMMNTLKYSTTTSSGPSGPMNNSSSSPTITRKKLETSMSIMMMANNDNNKVSSPQQQQQQQSLLIVADETVLDSVSG